jgi:hypothetical protein
MKFELSHYVMKSDPGTLRTSAEEHILVQERENVRGTGKTAQRGPSKIIPFTKYCHMLGVSVTNNNAFWIERLDLLALLYSYSQL